MNAHEPIELEGVCCAMQLHSPAPNIVVLTISGHDTGEFGPLPRQQLELYFASNQLIELFIDARETKGASIDVSCEWAIWLSANRRHFSKINMLTGGRYIEITANFVRKFSNLEGMMRLYSEESAFEEALELSIRA